MKKLVLSTTAIVALASGTASAADMALKGPRMAGAPFTCAAQQFAGAHIGVHAGSLYHDAKRGDTDGFLTDNAGWTMNHWGGHAGGGIGYDWATCSTVWGIEIDGSGVFGTRNFLPDNPNVTTTADGITTRVDAMFTARIRSGVALDKLLVYLTGGVAGASFRTTWAEGTNIVDIKDWRWGWTAGFGTEWAWTPSLSLKSEVLYASFSDRDHSATFTGPTTFNFRHSDSLWISRVGLTYRFGAR